MIARIATAFSAPDGAREIRLTARQLMILHAVAILAVVAPIILSTHPPLVDYANHLARIHVLATLADNPMLQEKYLAHWTLLPNLAMDALLVPLAKVVPIYLLGKLFVVATMLLFIGGAYALRWVLWGRIGIWPAAVLLIVYNHVLAWGFLNYLFGAGLALFALAGWIWARERWSWHRRAAVFALAALGLFFAHMFAFGVYALAIGGFELGRSMGDWREKSLKRHFVEWAQGGAQFVVPMMLWMMTAAGAGSGVTQYSGSGSKISAWVSMVLFQIQGVGVATLLFLVVLLVGGLLSRSIRLDARMTVPLLVLLAAMLAMPNWLFSSWGADFRTPPVLVAIAIASTDFERRKSMLTDLLLIMGAALIAMRVVSTVGIVRVHDKQIAELRAAFAEVVPPGTRLLAARNLPHGPERRTIFWRVHHHSAAYAVIDQSVYMPTLFTDPEKQPLIVTQRYRYMNTPYGNPVPDHALRRGAERGWADRMFARRDPRGRHYYWAFWPNMFDYVVVFRMNNRGNPAPRHMTLLKTGSYFDIYKVRRGHP